MGTCKKTMGIAGCNQKPAALANAAKKREEPSGIIPPLLDFQGVDIDVSASGRKALDTFLKQTSAKLNMTMVMVISQHPVPNCHLVLQLRHRTELPVFQASSGAITHTGNVYADHAVSEIEPCHVERLDLSEFQGNALGFYGAATLFDLGEKNGTLHPKASSWVRSYYMRTD